MPSLPRRVVAEFAGTLFLLAAVVGSGIMGERLAAGNVALALLANTIATGAALIALILAFGPISGAHFNPAVTLADAWQGGIAWREAPAYIAAQLAGAFAGVATAHLMFGLTLFTASTHVRSGPAQLFSEFIATFGLLSVIWGCVQTPALRCSLRCRRIHHRRLLVHCVHVFRQPGRYPRPVREQHFRRYQTRRRSRICRRPAGRSIRGNVALPMANPLTQGGGFRSNHRA